MTTSGCDVFSFTIVIIIRLILFFYWFFSMIELCVVQKSDNKESTKEHDSVDQNEQGEQQNGDAEQEVRQKTSENNSKKVCFPTVFT